MKKVLYMLIALTSMVEAIAQTPNYGGIIYVTPTGAGTHAGDSWANATSSIDTAQTLAQTYNAMVWVAAGTYYRETNTLEYAFTMQEGVNVYGGFAGNEPANYDLSQRDISANKSVLLSYGAGLGQNDPFETTTEWNGFEISGVDTFGNGGFISQTGVALKNNGILRNCTVIGHDIGIGSISGGWGIIDNCVIRHNAIGFFGHYCEISNCEFSDNFMGGGINGGLLHVSNCIIQNNTFSFPIDVLVDSCQSGGLSLFASIVSNCLISNNTTIGAGGGIQNLNTVYNHTIELDSVATAFIDSLGLPLPLRTVLINCDIVNNHASLSGGGVFTNAPSDSNNVELINCIVWGNTSDNGMPNNLASGCTAYYCAVEGGWDNGQNNITLESENIGDNGMFPFFADPASGDYTLLEGSACIDAGILPSNGVPNVDLAGNPRVQQSGIDIGCYEFSLGMLNDSTGLNDYKSDFSITVYPNPTSNNVNVQCTMNNAQLGDMELQLVDVYGRLLDVVETPCIASLQTVQIDLSRYAKGVYFIKAVTNGKTIAARKVVKQ